MSPVWEPESYAPRLESLPFSLTVVALMVVFVYASIMRGAPVLRAWFLLFVAGMFPYALAATIAASTDDPQVATWWYRVGVSVVPLAGVAGRVFQRALIGQRARRRWHTLISFAIALALVPVVVHRLRKPEPG